MIFASPSGGGGAVHFRKSAPSRVKKNREGEMEQKKRVYSILPPLVKASIESGFKPLLSAIL